MKLGLSLIAAALTVATPAAAMDWSGFYAGLSVGAGGAEYYDGATGNQVWADNLRGAMIGGQAGYMFTLDAVAIGIEVDASAGSITQTRQGNPAIVATIDMLASVRGRIGVDVDGVLLPYFTGGLLIGSGSMFDPNGLGGAGVLSEATHTGYTIGGGVEVAVTDKLSVRGEYLYGHLSPEIYPYPGILNPQSGGIHLHTARTGFNVRF